MPVTNHPLPQLLPRVALAHDWLVGMRGGERVLDRLAQIFGPTGLYTMVRTPGVSLTPAIDACTIHTSQMQRWPGAATWGRRWYLPLFPVAVDSIEIEPRFDLLISSSSAFIKSVTPPDHIPHICYCHAPARYIWSESQRRQYEEGGRGLTRFVRRIALRACTPWLRTYDRATAATVTQFIANSTYIAREIHRCLGREAIVVHPPVRTTFFTPDPRSIGKQWGRADHYLVVSALEPYKRIDLAIRAAMRLKRQLHIGGSGSQLRALQRMADPRFITFLGHLDDAKTRDAYRHAQALLFPGLEDFGIAPVEALACGCPVIAFSQGGAEDWFSPEVGESFDAPSVDELVEAMNTLESRQRGTDHIDAGACMAQAGLFSENRFDAQILAVVAAVIGPTRAKLPD